MVSKPGRPAHQVTAANRELVIRLRQSGSSPSDIARYLDISRSVLYAKYG